jgi:hypothetical protein
MDTVETLKLRLQEAQIQYKEYAFLMELAANRIERLQMTLDSAKCVKKLEGKEDELTEEELQRLRVLKESLRT